MDIIYYKTSAGKVVFAEWFKKIKDGKAKSAILRRLFKIEHSAHFGDNRFLRDGVSELRIDVGGGYRIYYSVLDNGCLVILAGTKKSQSRDIDKAIIYLNDFMDE